MQKTILITLLPALLKDGAVSDKERELVLSALFSRSDTGLLKGDSSPEMPSVYAISDPGKNNPS